MDLSVEAMVTTTELPYESVLVSKYQDGQERRHNISGTYQETLLTNVQVVEVIRSFFELYADFWSYTSNRQTVNCYTNKCFHPLHPLFWKAPKT